MVALAEKEDADSLRGGSCLDPGRHGPYVAVRGESEAGGRNLESLAPGVWEARDWPRSLGDQG